jgi:hypothetical protein
MFTSGKLGGKPALDCLTRIGTALRELESDLFATACENIR